MDIPQILAENIRRYRIIRGFDQAQMAERADISRVSYGKIETGKVMPRETTLERLADILNVSVLELIRPVPKPKIIFFRKLKTGTSREVASKDQTVVMACRWLENYQFLQEVTGGSDADLPDWMLKRKSEPLEDFAGRIRNELLQKEYPVDDLPRLLESHGIKVRFMSFETGKCFGFSFGNSDGGPALVINTGRGIPKERQLFSLVHELGHLLLHLSGDIGEKTDDGGKLEQEADNFAAAFLIPHGAFLSCWNAREDLYWFERIIAVKRIFKVSYKTVLRILDANGKKKIVYTWFSQGYKKRYGRDLPATIEPCPAEITFGSGNYMALARKAFEAEAITESRLAELLEENHAQIRERIRDWSLSTI